VKQQRVDRDNTALARSATIASRNRATRIKSGRTTVTEKDEGVAKKWRSPTCSANTQPRIEPSSLVVVLPSGAQWDLGIA
jgi:hypothetical protein